MCIFGTQKKSSSPSIPEGHARVPSRRRSPSEFHPPVSTTAYSVALFSHNTHSPKHTHFNKSSTVELFHSLEKPADDASEHHTGSAPFTPPWKMSTWISSATLSITLSRARRRSTHKFSGGLPRPTSLAARQSGRNRAEQRKRFFLPVCASVCVCAGFLGGAGCKEKFRN